MSDGNDDLRIVLWGDKALLPVLCGDRVEIYHATARPGRFGGIELGVGRGSAFRVPEEKSRPIVFQGTIISTPGCTFIDNGIERYLIGGDLPHGIEMQVTGLFPAAGSYRNIPGPLTPDQNIYWCRSMRLSKNWTRKNYTFTLRSPRAYMPMFNILMCHRRCARNG